jgi:hypothetical protein
VLAVFGIEHDILIRRCPDIDRDHNLVDTNVQLIFHMAENRSAAPTLDTNTDQTFHVFHGRDAAFKIY